MLCENCKKKNATIHYTEIVDNKYSEIHLCEDCAKQKGCFDYLAKMQPNLSWINLLAGLAEHDFGISHPVEFKKRCTRCGFTYDDFKKTQRLGCPDCYNTFQVQINKILRKIHGSIKHAGKTPGKTSKATKIRKEIEKLRKELQDAISLEEYERAAVLRDKIKEAEKILSKEE